MTWSSGEGSGLAAQVRQQRFSMAMRGYAIAEVDGFLDELAEGIERLQHISWQGLAAGQRLPAGLPTADQVREQTFTVAPNGYAMIEVDAFLDDVIEAVTRAWARFDAVPALPPPRAALELPPPAPGGIGAAEIRAAAFPRALRGYARRQVDDFLAHAADTLDRLDAALARPPTLGGRIRPPGMTATDVQRAGFFTALRGYAMPKVDDFLDSIAEALAARDELLAAGALERGPGDASLGPAGTR
jgi:DivIVA domain-containing protein